MQLAKDDVRPVSAQDFRHGLHGATHLVRVTENEITGLKRLLLRITSGDAASFYGRVTDAIPKSKRLCFGWQGMTVLSPDGFNSGHFAVGLPCWFKRGFQLRFIR